MCMSTVEMEQVLSGVIVGETIAGDLCFFVGVSKVQIHKTYIE